MDNKVADRTETIRVSVLLVVLVAIIGLVGLFAFGNNEPEIFVSSTDGPVYVSVAELQDASSVSITATIGEVVHTFANPVPGGDELQHTVEIVELASDDLDTPGFILRSRYGENVVSEGEPTLEQGSTVVLFLNPIDRSRGSDSFVEGIADFDGKLYNILGGKQGVFDVAGDGTAISQDSVLREQLGAVEIERLTTR